MKYFFLICVCFFLTNCEVYPSNSSGYPKTTIPNTSSVNEKYEFADLIEKDKINKKQRTAEVLTYLLNDPEPADKYTAAVIENTSNCDIIVRLVAINGGEIYNLPIAKNSKNNFKIAKGNYTLKSNVCSANYYTQKKISEPLILKLSND